MKYLKLGDNATSFYDMGTGLKISGKDVVAVNDAYINQGKRTRRALQGGHLIYATKEEYEEANGVKAEYTVESLSKKFYNLYQSGKSTKELADAFNKAQLVKIAEAAELEVEEADTKSSLVEAIIEQIESTDDETDEE
jgi:hypothetical protein